MKSLIFFHRLYFKLYASGQHDFQKTLKIDPKLSYAVRMQIEMNKYQLFKSEEDNVEELQKSSILKHWNAGETHAQPRVQ